MKSIHVFSMLCLVCLSIVLNAQIGAKAQQQNKVHGIWTNNDFGFQMTLILNAEGTGEFDGETISYKVQSDKLVMTQAGVTNTYAYVLQTNTLRLSGGDIEQPITFTRQGGATTEVSETPTSSNSENANTSSQASISSSNYDADKAFSDAAKAAGSIPKNLLGKWSGYNESMEFQPNGQCTYRGVTIPYVVKGNTITVMTNQGNVPFVYTIAGDQLNVIYNGQTYTYKRGDLPVGPGADLQKVNGKTLDMSIVGKWCYIKVSSSYGTSSNQECFTFKGDGTYVYYSESYRSVDAGSTASQGSDQGTWWIEGNRIFYNSYQGQSGSYELGKRNYPKTNDPMIVLNGSTYVTATNDKKPW